MTISPQKRWAIIGIALTLTLAAVNWVNQTEPIPTAQAAATETRPAPLPTKSAETPVSINLNKLKRAPVDAETQVDDLFKSKSWYVPPPPPHPLPPPPPTAPPLPFTYLGKMIEDGKLTVFLNNRDRNYVIKAGDIIDNTYRIDTITPAMLTLIYLPLNIKQSIPLGDPN